MEFGACVDKSTAEDPIAECECPAQVVSALAECGCRDGYQIDLLRENIPLQAKHNFD